MNPTSARLLASNSRDSTGSKRPREEPPLAKMKIAVVPKPGADFELQERDIPEPPTGHVRIRVQACGICFSDHLVKDGLWPGVTYPRSPGHEVASSTKSAQTSPLGGKGSA